MLCFISKINENISDLFNIDNNTCFIYAINNDNIIDIKKLITTISLLRESYQNITIVINDKILLNERIKIILLINYFKGLSYIIN